MGPSTGALIRVVLDDEEEWPVERDQVRNLRQEVAVGPVPRIAEAPVDKTLAALKDHEAEAAAVGIDREDPPGCRRTLLHGRGSGSYWTSSPLTATISWSAASFRVSAGFF